MNIGIVGLGLIGASLGLTWRSRGLRVLGVTRKPQDCDLAIARGIVDEASTDLTLLAEAEAIAICTPLSAILPTVEQLIPHLRPETIVTDVGSVKAPIVSAATQLWPNFVGGHPMAGTTESGIRSARHRLFEGKPYVLTPIAQTPRSAMTCMEELVRLLGATLYRCDPQDHDRAVAWVSHLPVFVSAALVETCANEPDAVVSGLARELSSSGFRDTTRVGGGNPTLGMMMARYNRENLLNALRSYRQHLDRSIDALESQQWSVLTEMFEQTQSERSEFRLDFSPRREGSDRA
jgi:arogenate dehydrogenase (NADP+)